MSISGTVVDRADIQFHVAAPALQPYVGCFWIITAQAGATVRIVPDGTASIAIERPRQGAVHGYLRGPLLRPIELRFAAPTTLVGVRLRPGVAFSLTGVATHSIVDTRIALRECEALRTLVANDDDERTSLEWIAALQAFLIARLDGTSIHPLVARVLDVIHRERGCIGVGELAARCETSMRHIARLMRDWIGFGPKKYAGIVRFQATLAQMERVPRLPAAELATEVGYFDQSHLHVDVSRYAGATPGRLISESVSDFSKTRCDVPY